MAFDNNTTNEWKQAFNADFFYAFILATFLLFNGLAFSDYVYFNSHNSTGFFINLNDDSFDVVFEICEDEMISESSSATGINIPLSNELMADLIQEIALINPTYNNELNTELIQNKTVIKSELNTDLIHNKKEFNSDLNNELITSINTTINSELINPNLNTKTNTLTTIIPSQEIISKNHQRITSESYQISAPIVATPRLNNVRNTIQHLATYTSHTSITTPQNKTFIKSEKNFSNSSKIDLEQLPEVSILLSDLIHTANLQGKNIILSFGAKWCLPCKQMDKNVYANQDVNQTINENYLFKKFNEKDLEAITLKKLFDVKVYPTTLIVDTNGNVISRYEESISKNRMMDILAENSSSYSSKDAFVKVDSSSQPIELDAAIDFLVSRAENRTLGFD